MNKILKARSVMLFCTESLNTHLTRLSYKQFTHSSLQLHKLLFKLRFLNF